MRSLFGLLGALALTMVAQPAHAQRADEAAFRAIYKEMVEIDSSATTGSCTRVAEAVARRLRAAGYSEADTPIIVPEGRPDDGNIVAILRGTNRRLGALLLVAHIDVVDARPEDWKRNPFTLVEENGFFYGRGAADDKSMAAVFVDLMIRFRAEGFRPYRDIKMALTCGEETSNRVNGVSCLLEHHRDLISADFAINEGPLGLLDDEGRPVALSIQAGEKIHQVMQLEVINPGGHSSVPMPDNAIYRLAQGLDRLAAYRFPVALNDTTRRYFELMAPLTRGPIVQAMADLARNPKDPAAAQTLSADPNQNAMMRTTCVATQLDAGHAANALPQRARATISCRVLPGQTPAEVRAQLESTIADPQIAVTIVRERQGSPAPPLTPQIMAPVLKVAERLWPGVPIIPKMQVVATDGRFLNTAGIPTYGMSGMFEIQNETFAHGLNEKIRVKSLMEGRAFLESVVREYVLQK